eukprot:7039852-Pyramimonas_sp.AAC.1
MLGVGVGVRPLHHPELQRRPQGLRPQRHHQQQLAHELHAGTRRLPRGARVVAAAARRDSISIDGHTAHHDSISID